MIVRLILILALIFLPMAAQAGMSRVSGNIPFKKLARAEHLGRKNNRDRMRLSVVLNPSDADGLEKLVKRLYDPNDSLFHKFITPAQFTESFGPSQTDVNQVVQYLLANGLRIAKIHPNRMLIEVEGSTANIENALQIEVHNYISGDGRIVHSATSDPMLANEIASKVKAIAGLSNMAVHRAHLHKLAAQPSASQTGHSTISDYMTPTKIKSAYNMSGVSATGTGETLALFELDGYTASDITTFANNASISITPPTLQNVLVGGASGTPGDGADEVTLDIELAAALAPGLTKIMVYEGPNTDAGVLATYTKIANDNLAKEISTSWGLAEDEDSNSLLTSENTIFQQMATQGQSIFAASGDNGAYDDTSHTSTLMVDDPASQPYVTGVGGTTLSLTGSNTYLSETSWNASGNGGGGGISTIWSAPSYQSSMVLNSDGTVSSKRMVPDVSLDANPSTGYPIFYSGAWRVYGGTSCAAPLWAAFAAIVNQTRVTNSLSRLGFVNPSIYQIGKSAHQATSFHDISDGSTNMHYPSVLDYDLATGWGSFNGANLYTDLTAASLPAVVSAPTAPSSPVATVNP